MRKLAIFLLFALIGSGEADATPLQSIDPVRKTIQQPRLTIPDTLLLSQQLYNSLVRSEKINQFNRLIGVYLNMAMDSLKKGRIEVAESIMMEDALPMLSHYGDGFNMYHSFMTLGKSYHQQKKYTQAKWFFIQSNMISQKIGYSSGELFSLIELAKVKESINENKLALGDYKMAAALASRIKFTTTLASIRKNIQRLNELVKEGDSTAAVAISQTQKN